MDGSHRGGVVVDNSNNAMNPSASPGGTQRSLRTSKPSSRAMQDFNQTGSIIGGASSDDLTQRPKNNTADFLTHHQQPAASQHTDQLMAADQHSQQHSQHPQPVPIPRGADGQPDFTNVLQGNATEYFPALLRNSRYKLVETLQASLFGSVKVAFDAGISAEVAIKISVKSLASHGRARSGAKVLENVKREANVMRYISSIANQRKNAEIQQLASQLQQQQHEQHQQQQSMDVDQQHSSNDYLQHATQQWEQANRKNGHDNVCALIEETDDEYFHYLVTEFVSGGDLHSLLLSLPNHRLPEPQAKYLFRQLAKGVRYLHIHNVAHLDLSLENVCVSNTGKAKIIDFGVAVIHPLAPKHNKRSSQSSSNSQQQQTPDQQQQPPASSTTSTSSSSQSSALLQTFLCSPISNPSQQPGKVGYMSPELYSGRSVWDAYSNDIFALGVILYCLLTGRPPFSYPSSQDPWFNFIASGHWIRLLEQAQKLGLAGVGGSEPLNAAHAAEKLSDAEKSQFQYVHIYSHLSPEALDLIDHILKPQHKRLGIDAILAHPWLQPAQQQ